MLASVASTPRTDYEDDDDEDLDTAMPSERC